MDDGYTDCSFWNLMSQQYNTEEANSVRNIKQKQSSLEKWLEIFFICLIQPSIPMCVRLPAAYALIHRPPMIPQCELMLHVLAPGSDVTAC